MFLWMWWFPGLENWLIRIIHNYIERQGTITLRDKVQLFLYMVILFLILRYIVRSVRANSCNLHRAEQKKEVRLVACLLPESEQQKRLDRKRHKKGKGKF